jgi:hypothetical protein
VVFLAKRTQPPPQLISELCLRISAHSGRIARPHVYFKASRPDRSCASLLPRWNKPPNRLLQSLGHPASRLCNQGGPPRLQCRWASSSNARPQ